jgi:hypothetical protein
MWELVVLELKLITITGITVGIATLIIRRF